MHSAGFSIPISFALLDNAQAVYPYIPHLQGPSYLDCVLEILSEKLPRDAFLHEPFSVRIASNG
jgi:hypothetical protein